jgi:hypothetical protein
MAIPEASGRLRGSASLHGVSTVLQSYFPEPGIFKRFWEAIFKTQRNNEICQCILQETFSSSCGGMFA